jgi:N-acetylglucosamine kinase-like BadF-type ATPase
VGPVTGATTDSILIAIDGGGSKTDGVAVDLDGNVLAQARLSGSSPHFLEVLPAVGVIDDVIRELCAQAGGRPILQTNLYLSSIDFPSEVAEFADAIADRPWSRGSAGSPAVIGNDMLALLRAGTREPDAVAVVCGTGINCIGVRRDGRQARFAALGTISGDWGGGRFLGEQALWHAARAADGRGEQTLLATMVPDRLGLPDVAAVIEAFHFRRLDEEHFADLTALIFDAADQGDAVATAVVERQAEEIVALAVAALTRLDLLDDAVPVVLGGGVLAAGHRMLLDGVEQRLAARAPKATMSLVRSRPVLGAALLTLETVGAPDAALDTAQAALEYRG